MFCDLSVGFLVAIHELKGLDAHVTIKSEGVKALATEVHHDVDIFSALDRTYGLVDGSAAWPDCLDALVDLAGVDACGLLLYDCGGGRSQVVEAARIETEQVYPVNGATIDEKLWCSPPGAVWSSPVNEATDPGGIPASLPRLHAGIRASSYSVLDRDSAHILYLAFIMRSTGRDLDAERSQPLENLLPHLHRACRLHRSMTGEDLITFAAPNLAQPVTSNGLPIELRLRRRFRLSKAEARVATLLADGQAPRMIADRLNVSIHTVRSQLQSIFSKTDTSRQAELTSLLLRETEIPRAICQPRPIGLKSSETSSCL